MSLIVHTSLKWSYPSITDCRARFLHRMRRREMDGPNEPSSQGVSSRVPVDHCWCQWPRHQRFIITTQPFCRCAENQDQSLRTAAATPDRKRQFIKCDSTFGVRLAFSLRINLLVFFSKKLHHCLSVARAAHSSSPRNTSTYMISLLYMSLLLYLYLSIRESSFSPFFFINGRSESINQLAFCWRTVAVIGTLSGSQAEVARRRPLGYQMAEESRGRRQHRSWENTCSDW